MGGVSSWMSRMIASQCSQLQWGPPGMGGVSLSLERTPLRPSSLQWGPPGMGGVSPGPQGTLGRWPFTSMGTSRNGRCEPARRPAGEVAVHELQWGPPGMGGVSHHDTDLADLVNRILQWGPPGMGGVRRRGGRQGRHGIGTSMGTSRNGRCEAVGRAAGSSPVTNFNGDLPEWEV